MRPRLPSEETVARVHDVLLQWVAPTIGIALTGFMVATDSGNTLSAGSAASLIAAGVAAHVRAPRGGPPTPGGDG